VAKLGRLRKLEIDVRSEMPARVLDGLTALQALETLTVSAPSDFGQEVYYAFNFSFSSSAAVSDVTVTHCTPIACTE
jgi:hypothetical protein